MRHRTRALAAGVLAATALAAGISASTAVTYGSGDLLLVAYQPHGKELIVDLGPSSALLGASAPVAIPQLGAADLTSIFGSPLPALKVALIAADGSDSYLATNGPNAVSLPG